MTDEARILCADWRAEALALREEVARLRAAADGSAAWERGRVVAWLRSIDEDRLADALDRLDHRGAR